MLRKNISFNSRRVNNREHVWAKSHGGFADICPMDSDAFNIRPADASVNMDRSNKDFVNVQPSGIQHSEATECWYNSTAWEPGSATKGQVARILFYMATRYEGDNGEMDLEVVDKLDTYSLPEHGKLAALLEWNNQYPTSDLERQRNERIFQIQQNRNPFVDHAEFANYIWDNQSPIGVIVENFSMSPKFPNPGNDVQISIKLSSVSDSPDNVKLFWGKTYDSEENQTTLVANENIFSVSVNLSDFQALEMVYFKVETTKDETKKYTRGTFTFPKAKEDITITSIVDIKGDETESLLKGNIVTVTGRVSANFDGIFYIQDGDNLRNGICVYLSLKTGEIGDSLVLTGEVSEYANLMELTNISYLYNFKNNSHVDPVEISINDINENYEGMLVKVKDVTFEKGGNTISSTNDSYIFSNEDGSSVIFSKQDSRIAVEKLPTGSIDIVGAVSQYNSTYQLLPRDINDFLISTGNSQQNLAKSSIEIFPNTATSVVKINTVEIIDYIKLFNSSGQLVLFETGNKREVYVEKLPAGLYMLGVSIQEKGTAFKKFLKRDYP